MLHGHPGGVPLVVTGRFHAAAPGNPSKVFASRGGASERRRDGWMEGWIDRWMDRGATPASTATGEGGMEGATGVRVS